MKEKLNFLKRSASLVIQTGFILDAIANIQEVSDSM